MNEHKAMLSVTLKRKGAKAFTVSVAPESLKETVRMEVPRAIVYDKYNGVLKLDANHPQIKRIREIVNEYMSTTVDDDPDGWKRDALYNELKSLTSAAEATSVGFYCSDAYTAKRDAEDTEAAKKWLSELKAQEAKGLEIGELPVWRDASGVICQIFKASKEEAEERSFYDPLHLALCRVFYYGYASGEENRRNGREGATV